MLKTQESLDRSLLDMFILLLRHRGPDDQGVWVENNIGLGHTRLSIQDLSTAAHQPMFSLSKRFVIVFNGEIYNYQELRRELIQQFNCHFITHSDTEVLVNAVELWGMQKTLEKSTGMFAFAVWDRNEKLLYLARDRFGEKPLYYGKIENDFVFASELKPIQQIYKEKLHIDRDVLATYMSYSYVPTPYSIYGEIKKLEPGSYLTINQDFNVHQEIYWSAIDVALQAKQSPLNISFSEAVDCLEEKLKQTLSGQMLADVPLGAFLSGGVDSSTIAALMQSLSNKPIKTFSVGFKEKKYDESGFAKAVAQYIGTEHTELIVTDKDAMTVIPKLAQMYDEPFADSSQIPTFLVSQLAKQHVTVALSGDGGDEIFGGYNRYFLARRVKAILKNGAMNQLIRLCPERLLNLCDYIPQRKVINLSSKLKKAKYMADALKASFTNMYEGFCTQPHENFVLQGEKLKVFGRLEFDHLSQQLSDIEIMMLLDTLNYLTDDILVKVDRAAMAVSLETRAPFLDHNIFEFSWSLPEKYKVRNSTGKLVLKELLYRHVPKKLIDRPKMGFGIPLEQWLQGSLVDWAEGLLDEKKINEQGFLNASVVRRYWNEHKAGKRNRQGILWNVLMFQQWLDTR